jgi:hypothetical protein
MKDFVVELIRGIHWSIGITAPRPEQKWIYALVRVGVLVAMLTSVDVLFVVIQRHWLYRSAWF